MIHHTMIHVAQLYNAGHYDAAVRLVLWLEHHRPHSLALIHRLMYAINPDWGI